MIRIELSLKYIFIKVFCSYDFIQVNQTQVKQFGLAQALINQVIMNVRNL